jgi:predicted CXXCH cytochrome family protein
MQCLRTGETADGWDKHSLPMRRSPWGLLTLWLAVTAAPLWADGSADPGVCALCHDTQAALAVTNGGHALVLDCLVCHEDRRPGSFGHGHRTIPRGCTDHHATAAETHPEPPRKLGAARLRRRCLACHDPHGSTNAHLVRTSIRVGSRFRTIDFQDRGGAVPAGFVDPTAPGKGLCEVCHRSTRFYPASGRGESHFTDDCTLCHDHGAGFGPVITDASCTLCHADEAARLAKASLHHARFTGRCSGCHAEATPEPGPGHRATTACATCHPRERFATHVPPGTPITCTRCHEPHGSDNADLIRDVIETLAGTSEPVRFDNLGGRVDGSFASASAPGTGLCEICHTRTRFYRADGAGQAHYTAPCDGCHGHDTGFAPR